MQESGIQFAGVWLGNGRTELTMDPEGASESSSSAPVEASKLRMETEQEAREEASSSSLRSKAHFSRSPSYLLTETLWMKAIRLSIIGMLSVVEVAIGLSYVILLSALEVVLLGVYAVVFLKRLVSYKIFGSRNVSGAVQRNGVEQNIHSDS